MSGLVEIFIDIIGPVLILVAIGAVAGRRLAVPPEPLAKLAFWVFGPAFMFDALANAGLDADILIDLAVASLLALAGTALYALVVAARSSRSRRSMLLTTTLYGNTGNFGLAMVLFTFGDEALPYAAVCLVVVNTVGLIVGVASTQGGWGGVVTALTRPMTLVIVPALIVNGLGLELPPIADRPIGLLAGGLVPLMLVTLGIQLELIGRPRFDRDVVLSLVGKLGVQPILAVLAVGLVGLSGVPAGAVIMQAAMPAAVFTMVLAIEQQTRPEDTATIVAAGTLASIVTLPVFIAYVT